MTQQINLYDENLRPRLEVATARNLAVTSIVVLLLIAGVAGHARQDASEKTAALAGVQAQVRAEQERLNVLGKAIAARRVSPALIAEQARVRAALVVQQEVMGVLEAGRLGNTTGFSEFMFGFARQAQSDLWLTGFSVSAGGEDIEMRGRLLDAARLPAYVQRLSNEAVFHGRRFATLDMHSVDSADAARTAAVPPASALAPPLARYVEFALRSAMTLPAPDAAKGSLMRTAERLVDAEPRSMGGPKP